MVFNFFLLMIAFLRLIVNHVFTSFVDLFDSGCVQNLANIITRKMDVFLLLQDYLKDMIENEGDAEDYEED